MSTTIKIDVPVESIYSNAMESGIVSAFESLSVEYQLSDLQQASLCLMQNPTFLSVHIPCHIEFNVENEPEEENLVIKNYVLELQHSALWLNFEDKHGDTTWSASLWDKYLPRATAALVTPALDSRQLGDKPSHLVASPEGWRHGAEGDSALMLSSLLPKE